MSENYELEIRFQPGKDKQKILTNAEDYEKIINSKKYNHTCFGHNINELKINYDKIVDYYKNGLNNNNIIDIIKFYMHFEINDKITKIYMSSFEINKLLLFYCVDNINFDILHIILENITEDELCNCIENVSSTLNKNILEHICSTHGIITNSTDINKLVTKRNYKGKVEDNVIKIITLLLNKSRKLITDNCYKSCRYLHHIEIIELMNNYINDTEINNCVNNCYICHNSSEQYMIITNVCKCKNYVHYTCLQKLIKYQRNNINILQNCKICNDKYKYNFPPKINTNNEFDEKIFFPENDIYPVPCMTNRYKNSTNICEKLQLSMYYLQTEKFEQYISEISNEEFKNFIELEIKYMIIKYNCSDKKYYLCDNLPSNYPKIYNLDKYLKIEEIINFMIK
jgi:hypothetical protein